MSSKFFGNKHEPINGSRGKQSKQSSNSSSRTNNKRNNGGMKKSGRGR